MIFEEINSYQFYIPTRTLFGAGQLNKLHEQPMPGQKAMVVISCGNSMKEIEVPGVNNTNEWLEAVTDEEYDIYPSAAIRRNCNEIEDMCRKTAVPLFLTNNSKGDDEIQ